MHTHIIVRRLVVACAILASAFVSAHAGGGAPVKMVIEAPEPVKPGGWLFTEGWPLTFSMEVENAVAFVTEEISSGTGDLGVRQALVIDDPDGCLDVRSFDPFDFPFEQGCAAEDESYFTFVFDPFDGPRLPDSRCNPGSDSLPFELVDDDYDSSAVESLNKAYIDAANSATNPRPVGPKSGGSRDMTAFPSVFDDPAFDCHGFGADIDGVPGLVVWADIGAFKVMDDDLNGTGLSGEVRRLRNGAGFVTSVTSVLLDSSNRSNVKATIIVPRGLFEPLVAIDSDVSPSGAFAGFDYVRQIDDGDPVGINSTFGTDVNVARARAIAADLPPIRVRVKAVLVDGPAPDFITDVNGDGKFTKADLIAEGHTLLSNVARYKIRSLRPYNFETGGQRCPPVDMLVAKDLDGADVNGLPVVYTCSTGSARSGRRVPR
jgi:hypothetical protein